MAAPIQRPANLRLLNGKRPGQDSGGRKVVPPPPFKREPPAAPEWLSEEARAEWDRVVPGLVRLDLLKPEDRAALATYCETWARFVEATAEVRETGLTIVNETVGKNGQVTQRTVKNPAVTVAETAAAQLRGLAHEFGFTPSSEGKLARTPDPGDESNPFE
jgi:P27 family predicted phage terminase small subunit